MRKGQLVGLLTLALTAPAVVGWTHYTDSLTLQPQSRLWVEGSSTVRGFECKATTIDAVIQTSGTDAANQVLAGAKAVTTASVTVPAKKLDCGNGTMNGHMYKAIKADAAPEITFQLSSYDLAGATEGVAVKMTGKLSIGGTERPVTLEAQAKQGPGGALLVTGSEEIKLSDFGLKAPTLMMGTMKVSDAVKVRYELVLKS